MKKTFIGGATPLRQKTIDMILSQFMKLAPKQPLWQTWSDVIELFAISYSTLDQIRYEDRNRRYLEIIKKYTKEQIDIITNICSLFILSYNQRMDQDLLGQLYMELKLEGHWKGQYFTPYSVSNLMSDVQQSADNENKKFITIMDGCCGSGSGLIAKINSLHRANINFQENVLIIAQELDYITALMCYIQLSILGCNAIIKIGDSLEEPISTEILSESLIDEKKMNLWYTPNFIRHSFNFIGA